jgi:hypothetical protein
VAWSEQWTIKVDGTHLNGQGSNFITSIPELETGSDDEVILVPIDGSPPAYIRNQPKECIYTFLIAMKGTSWAAYQTQMNTLRGILGRGPHTLEVQVRGMVAPASTTIIVRGWSVAPKERRVAVTAVVPVPIF